MKNSLTKYLAIIAGLLLLILGVIGIFIPILPTTPFLLLSSFLFLRSSERLYCWLMNHRILGQHIENYLKYKAVKKSIKIKALLFLWISLSISFYLVPITWIRILLIIVGLGVSIHLFFLKTIDK